MLSSSPHLNSGNNNNSNDSNFNIANASPYRIGEQIVVLLNVHLQGQYPGIRYIKIKKIFEKIYPLLNESQETINEIENGKIRYALNIIQLKQLYKKLDTFNIHTSPDILVANILGKDSSGKHRLKQRLFEFHEERFLQEILSQSIILEKQKSEEKAQKQKALDAQQQQNHVEDGILKRFFDIF